MIYTNNINMKTIIIGGVIEKESSLLVATAVMFRAVFNIGDRTNCEAISIDAKNKTVVLPLAAQRAHDAIRILLQNSFTASSLTGGMLSRAMMQISGLKF